MSARTPTLLLDRPAFWTEPRDPEVWLRALETLSRASTARPQTGTPRTVAERGLVGVLAWRGAVGMFGISVTGDGPLLHGVGLVALDEAGCWEVTADGLALVRRWRADPSEGLEGLAAHLVRESPWLRLLLSRLLAGDWSLDWARAREGRAGLRVGASLTLDRCPDPDRWFAGLDERAAGRWLARTGCARLALSPELAQRPRGKDDLSLAPLTAPLHLLEAVGWLGPQGALQLPAALQADLVGEISPADVLADLSARRADIGGYVAVEPTLRELLSTFGVRLGDEDFGQWMDLLVESAVSVGALEILGAEPGQARHGRGLFGDPTRKLVRWVVHPEFDGPFQRAWVALGGAEVMR